MDRGLSLPPLPLYREVVKPRQLNYLKLERIRLKIDSDVAEFQYRELFLKPLEGPPGIPGNPPRTAETLGAAANASLSCPGALPFWPLVRPADLGLPYRHGYHTQQLLWGCYLTLGFSRKMVKFLRCDATMARQRNLEAP